MTADHLLTNGVIFTCVILVPATSLRAAAASVSLTGVPFKEVKDFKRPITRKYKYSAWNKLQVEGLYLVTRETKAVTQPSMDFGCRSKDFRYRRDSTKQASKKVIVHFHKKTMAGEKLLSCSLIISMNRNLTSADKKCKKNTTALIKAQSQTLWQS